MGRYLVESYGMGDVGDHKVREVQYESDDDAAHSEIPSYHLGTSGMDMISSIYTYMIKESKNHRFIRGRFFGVSAWVQIFRVKK